MSPLPPELVAMMLDEVTLEHATDTDKFNNFVFADPVTAKCQIVRVNRRALDRSGRELISTVQIILADPTLEVSADDKLTLPDGATPAIIEVLSTKDEVGPYYLEVRA